ncbi:hypothetical protein F7725_023460 [Dissostichus mawsoni]|uniref:Uncharacterized protein n=1 Tax=Dissostichus mawsoni TaxID=36200 RepID=A0A7J5Z0T2_DISMA|nr:hypothetical protein F7725_023460 [Dissostichus mawsoni]
MHLSSGLSVSSSRSSSVLRLSSALRPSTFLRPSSTLRPSSMLRPSSALRPSFMLRPSSVLRPSTLLRPSFTLRPSTLLRPASVLRPSSALRPSSVLRPSSALRPSSVLRPSSSSFMQGMLEKQNSFTISSYDEVVSWVEDALFLLAPAKTRPLTLSAHSCFSRLSRRPLGAGWSLDSQWEERRSSRQRSCTSRSSAPPESFFACDRKKRDAGSGSMPSACSCSPPSIAPCRASLNRPASCRASTTACSSSCWTEGEQLVDVSEQQQQAVQVVLRGAALQRGKQQLRGLALHPLDEGPLEVQQLGFGLREVPVVTAQLKHLQHQNQRTEAVGRCLLLALQEHQEQILLSVGGLLSVGACSWGPLSPPPSLWLNTCSSWKARLRWPGGRGQTEPPDTSPGEQWDVAAAAQLLLQEGGEGRGGAAMTQEVEEVQILHQSEAAHQVAVEQEVKAVLHAERDEEAVEVQTQRRAY